MLALEVETSHLENADNPYRHGWVGHTFEQIFSNTQFSGVSKDEVTVLVRRALLEVCRRKTAFVTNNFERDGFDHLFGAAREARVPATGT